jgi:hypothetical protein
MSKDHITANAHIKEFSFQRSKRGGTVHHLKLAKGEGLLKESNSKGIMCKSNYNTTEKYHTNGIPDYLEKYYWRTENHYSRITRMIEKRELLNPQDISILAEYIACQAVRTTQFEKWLGKVAGISVWWFSQLVILLGVIAGKKFSDENEKELLKEWKSIPVSPDTRIMFVQISIIFIKKWLIDQNWHFVKVPNGKSLVLADNAFLIDDHILKWNPFSIALPEIGKYLPLSSEWAIVIFDEGNSIDYIDLDERDVDEINIMSFDNADRDIVANNKDVLKQMARHLQMKVEEK